MTEVARSEEDNHEPKAPKKTFTRVARRLFLLIMLTYLMCLAPLTYFQRSLIYHPSPRSRLLAEQSGLPQATFDVTVKSHDGLDLHGWLALAGIRADSKVLQHRVGLDLHDWLAHEGVVPSSESVSVDVKQTLANGRPVVLFFPGNAGDRSMRHIQIATLGSLNAHVLLVDYRGFADNAGKPSEANFARDARSVWNYLTEELDVPPHRIVIYGESLGGGSATRLASELCQEGIEPGGLIAQSTFSSLVAAAQAHFPILPVSLILVDRFPSDLRIRNVTCPILQIHGERDSVVPFRIGQELFDATPAKSARGIAKKQLILPNTDHNDVYYGRDNGAVIAELGRFLDEVANTREPKPTPGNGAATPVPNPATAPALSAPFDWTIIATVVIALLAALTWWMFRQAPRPNP